MTDERSRDLDLGPLRASDVTKRRVVGAALREIRELEARGPVGVLADAMAWTARLAPLILPAAAAVWFVLLLGGRGLEPSSPTTSSATPYEPGPVASTAAPAGGVDPAMLMSAWGVEGPTGEMAAARPDELLATFAETSP